MKTSKSKTNLFSQVQSRIITLRNRQVILDSNVAELYGVETREINQAVKNNPDKFSKGYVFELEKPEREEVIKNFDHLPSKYSPSIPKAFTEKGLYMLATILKSARATQTTIAIVETFAKIRELSRTVSELPEASSKAKQKELMQKSGEIFADILDDGLHVSDTETSFEIDLAVMKFKHIVRRKEKGGKHEGT
jgi:phage regulator Rha-like protein